MNDKAIYIDTLRVLATMITIWTYIWLIVGDEIDGIIVSYFTFLIILFIWS